MLSETSPSMSKTLAGLLLALGRQSSAGSNSQRDTVLRADCFNPDTSVSGIRGVTDSQSSSNGFLKLSPHVCFEAQKQKGKAYPGKVDLISG